MRRVGQQGRLVGLVSGVGKDAGLLGSARKVASSKVGH